MLTVEETIDQSVLDSLRGMSRAANYTADYTVAVLDPANGTPAADNQVVADTFADPAPVEDRPQSQDRWRKAYRLTVTVVESEGNYAALSARLRRAKADITKALTFGRAAYTRGGRALGTTIQQGEARPEVGSGRGTIVVVAEVLFATAVGDPLTNPYTTA